MGAKGVTLLQIDYFFAVAKYLNFTEAAKSQYVAQPSLSKQIALLENEIGVQLFFRTKRDVRLTPAGAVLLKELNGISEKISGAIEKATNPYLTDDSNLSIGCLEAMNTGKFLPVIIKKFKLQYPSVNIILESHSFKALREKLINGSLDLVFTLSFEIDETLDILWDTVYQQNSSVMMAATNPMAQLEDLTLADFKEQDFVMLSRDESPNGFDGIISQCRKHGFKPKVVKQLPNVESLLLCVESGLGVAIVDSNIRMHDNKNYKLIPLQDDYISVVMAWRKENMNPAVPLFTNALLSDLNV